MTADQLAAKGSSITGANGYDPKSLRNRAMITGATIGGCFGLYYGYTRKKNMLVMAGAGALMGGILSRLIMPKE